MEPRTTPRHPVLDVRALTKVYGEGPAAVHALRGVSLTVDAGDYVAIMGSSGSGKSTLMNIIGCLDAPSGGSYLLDGVDVGRLADRQLALVRNRLIGFVFQ
ncbi:ATP-binding cassette domain-containing protein, partial [Micromonospora sp. DH15]|nr:ATP-binding cassette domain-containing protein [Micromonospora sp. DH15]